MNRITDIARSKSLSWSVESFACQFLQQRSVSKTAKGKGKGTGKTEAPLKRSIVSTKKGAAEKPSSKSGESRKSELEQLVDECLNASSPVRHLKPKEIEREAEREKMGLLSKARKLEIEYLKKKKSEKDSPSEIMGTPGLDLITLGLVDADAIPKYELTIEDGQRLAKEYSRVLMRRHRARQAAETTFLRLKKEAIEALPEPLKAAALVPDLAPFPVNRFMATLTPPIEGYIEKVNEAAKKNFMKEKLR
ncbi:uncharacterized protein LOC132298940 [Cornus florida]|uniref:uncharacterized protein LOC132298940 n=1 Tax=Cornus florida TaxID=4283 RepID=UPI002898160F|nr:uncharacterized protein LOC132298940 [Cornus florida]